MTVNTGSTHVARDFLICLVSFDFRTDDRIKLFAHLAGDRAGLIRCQPCRGLTLLASTSHSLSSALTRLEATQPFRISGNMLPVSMNYFIG